MSLPAVLFDFDGTVMDSEPAVLASYLHVFEIYASAEQFTPERRIEVLGPPLDQMMPQYFPDADVHEVMEEYRRYQTEHLKELMNPMPGAEEILRELRREGYRTGIITSRLRASLEHILDVFEMNELFDVLVCQDDGLPPKPAPDGILKACRQLGCKNSIYVGDSVTDLAAGKNAGAVTIAVLTTPGKEQPLRDFGPDYAVHHLSEILEIMKGIRHIYE